MKVFKKGELKKVDLQIEELKNKEVKEIIETSMIIDIETDTNLTRVHNTIVRHLNQDKKALDLYLSETKQYVDEYKYLGNETQKKETMIKYLAIARYHYNISYNLEVEISNVCQNCGEPDPYEYCFRCGAIDTRPDVRSYSQKKARKDRTEKVKNLEKLMDNFEGKKLLTNEETELLNSILLKDMDRDQVLKLLTNKKLGLLKKKINRIMFEFFNVSLISLDSLREKIKEKYLMILEVFDEVKPEQRLNSLTTSLIFHCLLVMENIPANTVQLLKTPESLVEQMNIMKTISLILSIREPSYNWDFENTNNNFND